MIDPRIEELLEDLYVRQVEHQADPADDSPAEVLEAAIQMGCVRREGLQLTPTGLAMARDVVRRHRLAECLLRDVLDVTGEELNAEACEFEHVLKRGLDEKICVLLGHPASCPHGRAIPPGPCCAKARADASKQVSPLCDGQVGAEGAVAYLRTADRHETQKLMAIGVLPGVSIRLLRRFPSYVFQVGYSQFTVDRQLAEKIHVHWRLPETK